MRKPRVVRGAAVLVAAAVAAAGLAGPASAQVVPPRAGTDTASAYQLDAAHNGYSPNGVAAPPLNRQWSRDLGGLVSYPVIAGGRVFATATSASGGFTLHAMDARTGADVWGPVALAGTYSWSGLTYGDGRVYVLNYDGVLTAFAATTGQQVWQTQLTGQYSFTSAPTFRAGTVYTGGAGSGGTLYAVDAATGAVRWTQPVMNGDDSSPAVTAAGVYVSYACEQAYAFAPGTGAPLWHHATGCEGGGGRTPVVGDNGLWIRDDAVAPPTVLNLSDGSERGTFGAGNNTPAPAIHNGTGYFVADGALQARRTASPTTPLWTFTGDGQLVTAPILVNGYVYVGSSSGQLYAVNAATGAAGWSTDIGAPITAPDEHNAFPLTGLAAAQGHLLVPATTTLTSYGR